MRKPSLTKRKSHIYSGFLQTVCPLKRKVENVTYPEKKKARGGWGITRENEGSLTNHIKSVMRKASLRKWNIDSRMPQKA